MKAISPVLSCQPPSVRQYEDYLHTDYWLGFRRLVHGIYASCLYPSCDNTNLTTAHLRYPDRYHERFGLVLLLCLFHHIVMDSQGVEYLQLHWILPKQQEMLEAWRKNNPNKERFCEQHQKLEFILVR